MKFVNTGIARIYKNLDVWYEREERKIADIRKKKEFSSQGKVKGIDLDDSWR